VATIRASPRDHGEELFWLEVFGKKVRGLISKQMPGAINRKDRKQKTKLFFGTFS
jgi:hypothetical protein